MIVNLVRIDVAVPSQAQANPQIHSTLNQQRVERVSEAVEVNNVIIIPNIQGAQQRPKEAGRTITAI